MLNPGVINSNIGRDGVTINPATSDKQLPDNHQVTVSNPIVGGATEDSLMLLRDIRKLLKASAYKDVADRQIVKIGAIGGITGGTNAVEITTTMPVSGTVAVSTTNALNGLDARMQMFGQDRVKYAVGMRNNLAFS